MDFITLQSRVVWGYVGNAIAVPTLQALGINAWPVDTVRYPHHPGHGPTFREVTDPDVVGNMLNATMACIEGPAALLSGYLASAEQGQAAIETLDHARHNGHAMPLYLDPVFGDDAEGIYVDPSLVRFFKTIAVPAATLVMPNRFELAALTDRTVASAPDAVNAARQLIRTGPELVLVSSVPTPDARIANLVVSANEAWICSVQKLPLLAKGTGDMFSAAFSGLLALGQTPPTALAMATAIIRVAVEDCSKTQAREINLPYTLNRKLSLLSPVPVDGIKV